jgi:AcrR family transcriptional regulator
MASALQPLAEPRPRRRDTRHAHVNELQRTRLIAALIAAVDATGQPEPTVSQIIGRARLSRKTFYDLFRDREDCFLAAFDETFSRARTAAVEAYAQQGSWRQGVRAALSCLLALIDEQPVLARLCVVHSLGAGGRVRLRHGELMAELADVVDLGREARAPASELSRMTAEVIVGGVHAVVHCRLVRMDEGKLHELLGPLMSVIVLPYLGSSASRKESGTVSTSPPIPPALRRRQDEDPLRGIHTRMTYRTVRVLVALSGQPGASNREVAAAAGILDQGQMSKLLARLARLGLIENHGGGQPKGAANAWWLTADGARLERATRPRFI